MKVIHIVESFSAGSFSFISEFTKHTPDIEHIIIHGYREDTPSNFVEFFPKSTEFYPWKYSVREIRPIKDFMALIYLLKIIFKQNNIDIIHLHSSKAGFLGRCASRLLGLHKKVLYTPHAASFLRKDVSKSKQILFKLIETLGSYLGGQIVACSKSEQIEFSKIGIEAEVIENGVNIPSMVFKPYNQLKIIIGTMGRISSQKNPFDFNLIASSFTNNPYLYFRWIGDGDLRNSLTSSNIEVTGWLDKSEATQEMLALDLYLSTSKWEGLPLSVLEAMAYGKPLLLKRCVGNIDLVVEGTNGYLFDDVCEAIDLIFKMINDSEMLYMFSKKSRFIAENNFSIMKMVSKYISIYNIIISDYKDCI